MSPRVTALVCVAVVAAVFGGYAVYAFNFWEADTDEIRYTEIQSIDSLKVEYVSGTEGAFKLYSNSYGENTVRFTTLSEDSEYAISGVLKGNIEIDSGTHALKLDLDGLNVASNRMCPIEVKSGSGFTIESLSDSKVGDMRQDTDGAYAVKTTTSLNLTGTGALYLQSTHNSGLYSGSLTVSTSTFEVDSVGDAVTTTSDASIDAGSVSIRSHEGSGIVSSGDVSVGGTTSISIRSSMNGIQSKGGVTISGEPSVSIHTADMAPRSDMDSVFVGYADSTFKFSIKAKDENGKDVWINPSGDSNLVYNKMAKSYVYSFKVPMSVHSITIYAYTSSQVQGQDSDYYAKSGEIATGFDRNSFLVTQCIKYAPIKYRLMNFGGPEGPDFDRIPTAGIDSEGSVSITGGTLDIDSNGDSIHTKDNVTIDGAVITAFSRNNTISCQTLTVADSDVALVSTGDMGSAISASSGYDYMSGRVLAVSSNNKMAESSMGNCDDLADSATQAVLTGIGPGSYIRVDVSSVTEVVLSMPSNDSGFPRMEDHGHSKASNGNSDTEKETTHKDGQRPDPSEILVTYLGSSSAEITNPQTIDVDLDDNGIYWG